MTDTAPTPLPAPVRPKFYITTVGKNLNGTPVAVGWDYCGKCDKHINNCTCAGGVPTEPTYITNMRKRELEADLARAREKAAATPVRTTSAPVSSSTEAAPRVPLATSNRSGQSCTACHLPADETNADQNDDGSWTHHDCQ